MPAEGDYSRLYHCVVDDERFVGIYDDDAHWACYTRLLMLAEAAWPSSAPIPRSARQESIDALAQAGIIELQSGDRFRIHGLDGERAKRSGEQINGGMVRAKTAQRDAGGHFLPASKTPTPPAPPTAGPPLDTSAGSTSDQLSKDEQRRAKTSTAPVPDLLPSDLLRAVEARTQRPWGFYPGSTWYDTMAANYRDFGLDRVVDAMDAWLKEACVEHPNAQQLVAGADRALHPLSSQAGSAAKAQADVERRIRQTREEYLRVDLRGGEHPPPLVSTSVEG